MNRSSISDDGEGGRRLVERDDVGLFGLEDYTVIGDNQDYTAAETGMGLRSVAFRGVQ